MVFAIEGRLASGVISSIYTTILGEACEVYLVL